MPTKPTGREPATVAAVDATALQEEALGALAAASSPAELTELRSRYLGRKSELKLALRNVRDRETGMTLNLVRERLETAFAEREAELERAELDRRLAEDDFDVTLPGDELPLGQLHPTTQIRRIVEDAFLGLGYEVRDDREVETVEYNFDKLAFAPTHPSRSPRDTFFLDGDTVLRTETSPSQIHMLEEREPPIYMVSIGRVYRRDAITATRFPMFHQFEGLAVDRGLTLADLKGTLLHVMRALFGEERRVRFRTHFFPFTEPSIEPDISCGICGGAGCRTCKFTGWIELGGAGMVDPQVFRNVGVDPEEWSGFAFGCGLERSAQLRHDISEIRPLWSPDLRVLRQF
jgi:phenylalanyl-tRNA synthetase alpha chain